MKDIKCINCGMIGHTSKYCNYPITSYGLICVKFEGNTKKYLMVQRKDSLSYTEFIRGKYTLENIDYLLELFSRMTELERLRICHYQFDDLWNSLWVDNNMKFNKDYNTSKTKFNTIQKGYTFRRLNGDYIKISLIFIISKSISILYENEWEFPKGRRKINESDICCAFREFEEETGIPKHSVKMYDNNRQYECIYIGTNNVRYRNIYYLVELLHDVPVCVDFKNRNQIKEVKDIQWFSQQQVLAKMHQDAIEKIELFNRINIMVGKKKKNSNNNINGHIVKKF